MKSPLNMSAAQAVEQNGSVSYPETLVSIATGNGASPITGVWAYCFPGEVEGGDSVEALIPSTAALISVIRFTSGVPVADIVNTAHVTDDGVLSPGVDVGSDKLLILWQVPVGDPMKGH
jgi:hypothetical protein